MKNNRQTLIAELVSEINHIDKVKANIEKSSPEFAELIAMRKRMESSLIYLRCMEITNGTADSLSNSEIAKALNLSPCYITGIETSGLRRLKSKGRSLHKACQ